ncbi:hypothetical protein N9P74_00180 [bacterium]|nr:hypothetical protein [bacterium]MDB0072868.1 hypothetical protein [bacterium]MDB4235074.1 hypothetical protein [bacterium]MDB4352040.1 hypothetical protein [Porticoccaceae bacterium]
MDDNLMKAGTENFTLPHDVVKLPSGGKFYKNKKKSVKVGYLTASDENMLISALQSNAGDLTYQLLRSKVYEPDMRPEDLIDGDIEAILLFLRNTSFGPEYEVRLQDPGTSKMFDHTIVLDELDIIKPEFEPTQEGYFVVKLPKSDVTIKLRPITFGESREIESKRLQYPTSRVAPIINWKLEKQIIELNGDEDKGKISKFINEMPIFDSKFIRKFLDKNVPALDLKRSIYAPSGELVTSDVTFGVEFFRPFF